MATYEYECKKCGEKFEVRRHFFQKETQATCPKCGSAETRRVYSTFGTSSGSRPPLRFG